MDIQEGKFYETVNWSDDEGWSEWTSDGEWDVKKVDVQFECIDGNPDCNSIKMEEV